MTDQSIERSEESLSALMDGEVNEFELRQVLKEVAANPELAEKWQRYQSVSAALRRQSSGLTAAPDLSAGVMARLADEPALAVPSAPGARTDKANDKAWLKPLAGIAVAASVSAMAIMFWQSGAQSPGLSAPAAGVAAAGAQVPAATVANSGQTSLPAGAYPVNTNVGSPLMRVSQQVQPAVGSALPPTNAEIIGLSAEDRKRLEFYMMSHSGSAGVSVPAGTQPFARAAAASESGMVKVGLEP